MTSITLAGLALLPRWVGWRNERRNGKPTKIPFSPRTGRMAKANDPGDWALRRDAEAWVRTYVNGSGGGVGLQFGPVQGQDYALAFSRSLHGGFRSIAALMSSGLVVLIDPEIEIGLKLCDGVVDLFAESDAIELVEQSLVEPLDNTIRLRAFRFGPRVIDVFHGQVELVFMPVVCAAILVPRSVSTRCKGMPCSS